MLSRLNKLAYRSSQLRKIALTKRAALGMVGKIGLGMGTANAVGNAKKVVKEKFDPAKRDLMLGVAKPG